MRERFELILVTILARFAADILSAAVACWFGLARFDGLRRTSGSEPKKGGSQRTANEQILDDSV